MNFSPVVVVGGRWRRLNGGRNNVAAAVSVLTQLYSHQTKEATITGRIKRGQDVRKTGEMAEALSEEEEENMMRDTREQVVRRQPNSSGGNGATVFTSLVCFEVIQQDVDSMC